MWTRRDLAAGVLGLVLGALLAWRLPAAAALSAPAPVEAQKLPSKKVICTTSARPAPEDCDDSQVRLDVCHGRLRAANRPRPTTAPPEAVGLDDPQVWQARLKRLLAACHIDGEVVSTDCAEYPCVTALRLSAADANKEEDLANRCDPGLDMGPDEALVLVPVPVDCGDGRFQTLWMFAALDHTTFQTLYPTQTQDFFSDLTPLILLGSRRAEAVARDWRCDP